MAPGFYACFCAGGSTTKKPLAIPGLCWKTLHFQPTVTSLSLPFPESMLGLEGALKGGLPSGTSLSVGGGPARAGQKLPCVHRLPAERKVLRGSRLGLSSWEMLLSAVWTRADSPGTAAVVRPALQGGPARAARRPGVEEQGSGRVAAARCSGDLSAFPKQQHQLPLMPGALRPTALEGLSKRGRLGPLPALL